MEEDLSREIYRRKICCLFWIEDNIEKINEICKRKRIFAVEIQGKVHKIISPDENMVSINSSKNSAANANEILQPEARDTKGEFPYNAQNTKETFSSVIKDRKETDPSAAQDTNETFPYNDQDTFDFNSSF